MVLLHIITGLSGLFAVGIFIVIDLSLRTSNFFWIDWINKYLPASLHFSNPANPDFWNSISSRPWSDPMPTLILSCVVLCTIVIVCESIAWNVKADQRVTEINTKYLQIEWRMLKAFRRG